MIKEKITRLILLLFLLFGVQTSVSIAGGPGTGYFAERPSQILVSYFDIANGSSYVQVTNTDSINSVTIHVQIFADLNNCVDRDFTDTLTPNETHVYDISNLQSANGNPINFALPADSHGFVLISAGDGMGSDVFTIMGNFRIVRDAGYEYRVNSAASDNFGLPDRVARFTNDWGANQADIIGVRVVLDPQNMLLLPDGTLDLSVQITDPYELFIFDNEETGTSCGESVFGCDERPGDDDNPPDDDDFAAFTADFINQGINDIFPNTRGGLPLCSGDLNTDGYIRLGGNVDAQQNDFVGYVGINDGARRGSMDRFKDFTLVPSG